MFAVFGIYSRFCSCSLQSPFAIVGIYVYVSTCVRTNTISCWVWNTVEATYREQVKIRLLLCDGMKGIEYFYRRFKVHLRKFYKSLCY